MALPSTQYFSNAIVGQMMVGADVNIFRADVNQAYAIGQGFQDARLRQIQEAGGRQADGKGQLPLRRHHDLRARPEVFCREEEIVRQ